MSHRAAAAAAAAVFVLGMVSFGCQSGGVGDPCVPEDEYQQGFGSFAEEEVNIESRSFQCETRVCLVNHFRGRVSCPYGQKVVAQEGSARDFRAYDPGSGRELSDEETCHIPGTAPGQAIEQDGDVRIRVSVNAQNANRLPYNSVYCSCRCDGKEKNARYCSCPRGFVCKEILSSMSGLGSAELAGSYCIRENDDYSPTATKTDCSLATQNCGPVDGNQYLERVE